MSTAPRAASRSLLPQLLGDGFAKLAPPVQRVHDGRSRVLRGRARVERGTNAFVSLIAMLARLPASQDDGPVEVQIEAQPGRERWTRRFGASTPMISTLEAAHGELRERLGIATLRFRLSDRAGAMVWQLVGVSAFGVPLPARWFMVDSRSTFDGDRYRFIVDAAMRGIGRIVRYEGVLDVD